MPIRIQRNIAILSVVLFAAKLVAWYLTHSVTILTDALESIVNVVAGLLGLYSIILSARPRDTNHPYGHSKAEFLSAAVEGTLIILSGILIIYEAVHHLIIPPALSRLDTGLVIITAAGAFNFAAGWYAEKAGREARSVVLESAGQHLKTDAYSTVGIIVGLGVLVLTHGRYQWVDSAVAMVFAVMILFTGYKVLRRSISGMMDEMDMGLVAEVIEVLQNSRQPQWVDLHNLRVIQYGTTLHLDAHMTLPWYFKVADADKEIHQLENLIKTHFRNQAELFIHIDGCMHYQCRLCAMPECPVRQHEFEGLETWTIDNVWTDAKHGKGPDDGES